LSANSVMRGRLDARRTLKSLVADLRQIKDWDKICEEEGKMTSPIICYILLGVILFIILMRILSILQFLRLKRKVKKRISPKHDKPSCK
ncbi:hypothetical protein, partial [Parabacteroides distasonis]